MAATQSSLHQFYKTKKSARDINTAKNAKNSIFRVPEAKIDELSTPNIGLNAAAKASKEECTSQTPSIILVASPAITKSQKTTLKKSSLAKKERRPAGTQDIAAFFERVAAKRKRQDDDHDETESTKDIGSENSETVHATPPVTPKRKKEKDEDEKRKRRKEANAEGLDRTPSGSENVPVLDAPKSAKKKLIMGVESSIKENTKEEDQDAHQSSSPRKMLSPKKLTPAEIKERLGRCGRLDQLRAKLLKVNQCEEKLKQFKENTIAEQCRSKEYQSPSKIAPHPQLEKFAALDVEVPVSPRKTPIKTPSKTPVKAPAHERFQHLIEKPSEELVLPFKYRFVKEVFRAVDTVVSLLHNRQEVITFSKLKPAVQEMLRKTLHERHLGEIKTVFPLAYLFKQELAKNTGKSAVNNGYRQPYELTISANMEYKSVAQNLIKKLEDSQPQNPKFRKMNSIVMVERRNIFHNSLINILRDHHKEFLKSLDPPILNCDANIKRWHPAFPLEDVPDIEPSLLPQPPTTEKLGTAKDILNKAQELFSVNPRLEKAVSDAAAKTPQKEVPEPAPPKPVRPTDIAAALKGVSSSLLEKIRAREAAKAARDMTRTSSENKELEMLSRLPEISRIIRNIFITEKKAALPWELVSTKVSASYPSMMASNEVDSHLNLLIKEVPGWCTVHNVRSGVFLKINKNEPQSNINEKLEAVIKQRR